MMWFNKELFVLVNFDVKNKVYNKGNFQFLDMDIDDLFLVVCNFEVICGCMDKFMVGEGKKNFVFYVILRDYGVDYVVVMMNCLVKFCVRFLILCGFFIGVGDVFFLQVLIEYKFMFFEKVMMVCDGFIF